MKIILQRQLIPRDDDLDAAKWAKDHGVDGLEAPLFGGGLAAVRRLADAAHATTPILSLCGNVDDQEKMSFHFVDADYSRRRASIEGCKAGLRLAGELGALGQIVPPMFGQPAAPDLSPLMDVATLQDKLMVEAIRELGPVAERAGTHLFLEPLNRYEQSYLRRQADGVRVIESSGSPAGGPVSLLSDFFHMHIEETDTPAALREAGPHVGHVHLADNTRMEPGSGDIDFRAGFKALAEIGFDGGLSYECQVSGADATEKERTLKRSLEHVRTCLSEAGA